MKNFRVAILDYPKMTIGRDAAREAFIGMISSKQDNFQRANQSYVTLDSLDMISTHVLIYDTSELFKPKPVLAIRVCYENRTKKHKLVLPIDNYFAALPQEGKEGVNSFRLKRDVLVDCNAWFVDTDYTFSKTKVPLSDIGFFFVALTILRKGYDHLVGCSNEKFKASRWVNDIGTLVAPVTFIHPKMPTEHQLVLIDQFSKRWLTECFKKYSGLVDTCYEMFPDESVTGEKVKSIDQVYTEIVGLPQPLFKVG